MLHDDVHREVANLRDELRRTVRVVDAINHRSEMHAEQLHQRHVEIVKEIATIDERLRTVAAEFRDLVKAVKNGDGVVVRLQRASDRIDKVAEGLGALAARVDGLTTKVSGHDAARITARGGVAQALAHGITAVIAALVSAVAMLIATAWR